MFFFFQGKWCQIVLYLGKTLLTLQAQFSLEGQNQLQEEGGKVTSGSDELDESDSTFLSKKRSPSCKASFNLHIMFDTSDLVDLYQGVTLLVHYLSANRQIVILS